MARFLYIYAGMIVLAAVLARLFECPSLFRLPATPALLVGSLALATMIALTVVEAGKLLEQVPWYRKMAELLRQILTAPELLGPTLDPQKALVIAAYSSIGEEALFRGFVQPLFIQKIAIGMDETGVLPATLGIVAGSLVFGVLHFPMVKELRPWTIFAIVAGLVFGGLAAWSESLLAPVVAHFLINWLNLRRLATLKPA
jgi:membrane protease YdiL (CAAX protease family)